MSERDRVERIRALGNWRRDLITALEERTGLPKRSFGQLGTGALATLARQLGVRSAEDLSDEG